MANNLMSPNETLPQIQGGLTKKQISDLADRSVDNVLESGNVFPVAEALAAMEEFVKTVRRDERYIQFLRDERDQDPNRGIMSRLRGRSD